MEMEFILPKRCFVGQDLRIQIWRLEGALDENLSNASYIWWRDLCATCGGKESSNWLISNFKWDIGCGCGDMA